jgi:hypothetical protein
MGPMSARRTARTRSRLAWHVSVADLIALALLIGVAVLVAGVRGREAGAGGGALNADPTTLKATAADLLAATTAKGGAGYRFEIVQRSTLLAKPGGLPLMVPDPADPSASPRATDAVYVIGLVETGFVTPAGFYMEMRAGPSSADAPVDLASGDLMFRALVRDGVTYRDDGEGWYRTDRPPGIGLDPITAAALPGLLRHAADAQDAGLATAQGELGKAQALAIRAISATGAVADIPGVIAVDGAGFTKISAPIDFTFDSAGRLVGLVVTARNTNATVHDLAVVTEITLRYDDVPTELPRPEPVYAGDGVPVTIP